MASYVLRVVNRSFRQSFKQEPIELQSGIGRCPSRVVQLACTLHLRWRPVKEARVGEVGRREVQAACTVVGFGDPSRCGGDCS